jgi:hypothetical protein
MEARACAPEQRPPQNRHERLRPAEQLADPVPRLEGRRSGADLDLPVLAEAHAEALRPLTAGPLGLDERFASGQNGGPPRAGRQTAQSTKGSSSSSSPDDRDARHAGTRNSAARKATLNASTPWTQGSSNPL